MENRGYSKEKTDAIMASQKEETVFLQKADVVIHNEDDFASTAAQIDEALCQGRKGDRIC